MTPQSKVDALTVALIMLTVGAGVCRADITYSVDQTEIGFFDGSVTGTITTDGTTSGSLGDGNIVAWNLMLSEGEGSGMFETFHVTNGADSTLAITGNALTATPTELLFNFDAVGDFEITDTVDTSVAWVLAGGGVGGAAVGSVPAGFEGLLPQGVDGNLAPLYFSTQPVVIGTAAVPEPSMYGLSTIMLGLALALRKRIAH